MRKGVEEDDAILAGACLGFEDALGFNKGVQGSVDVLHADSAAEMVLDFTSGVFAFGDTAVHPFFNASRVAEADVLEVV